MRGVGTSAHRTVFGQSRSYHHPYRVGASAPPTACRGSPARVEALDIPATAFRSSCQLLCDFKVSSPSTSTLAPSPAGPRGRLPRKQSFLDQLLSQRYAKFCVDREHANGGPADRSQADEDGSFPAEMALPFVPARMKQGRELSRHGIVTGRVWSLAPVAVQARIGQIAENGATAVLASDDVLDLEGSRVQVVGEAAILAGTAGPSPNRYCERFNHCHSPWPGPCQAAAAPWTGGAPAGRPPGHRCPAPLTRQHSACLPGS